MKDSHLYYYYKIGPVLLTPLHAACEAAVTPTKKTQSAGLVSTGWSRVMMKIELTGRFRQSCNTICSLFAPARKVKHSCIFRKAREIFMSAFKQLP